MSKIAVFFFIYVLGESLAFFAFKLVNFLLLKTRDLKLNLSVIKGMIERLFLFLALVYGIPHARIAFGAIKIGTRIRPDEKITNDYFFIGNMISLTLAIVYCAFWRQVS